MATGPKKRTTSRSAAGATRGRKASTSARKTRAPASRQSRAAGPAKAPARKTSRKQAAPSARATRTTAAARGKRTTTELATQLERISHDLEDLRDLRTGMQELRARFEAFARQIETLLTSSPRNVEEDVAAHDTAADDESLEGPSERYSEAGTDEDEVEEPTSALD